MFESVEVRDIKQDLGSLVKALRKQRGMSQSQLASSLNVSRTTIQNLELGRNFTIDTILKVLKEMDLLTQLQAEISQAKNHVVQAKSMY